MKRILFISFLLLLSSRAIAIDTLVLEGSLYKEYILGGAYLEILEDKSKQLTIQDIFSDSIQKKFQLNTQSYAYNFDYKSAYWVRFVVKNSSGTDRNFVLESYSPNTETIQLYYRDRSGRIQRKETGAIIKKYTQEYKHKNLVLDLPVADTLQSRTFYVRVFSDHHSGFDYRIKSVFYFSEYSNNEYYILGLYYGMLLIMAVYNLIVFFTLKARIHLYYVFYILSGILSTLTEDKLGYHYLWQEYPLINSWLTFYIAPILLLLTFILYSVKFLELRKNYSRLYWVTWGVTLIYLGIFAFSMIVTPVNYNLQRFFFVLPFFSIYATSWYTFFKGYKAARLFLTGTTILVISIILIQLRADHYITPNAFTVYFLNYSLIAESVVLSLALSDRIKIMQKDKEEAQQKVVEELQENKKLQAMVYQQLQEKQSLQEKVNRELEGKVSERTKELKGKTDELEVANIKLQALIEQANKMNIKLDLDNWELKKNVQHGLLQRITGEEVSFDVFQTVFKDEFTCYKFLDELKWQNNYACRKCTNTKYKETDKNFTKKCSKCSYPESVTSHTILHGIKFPVNKSLYLIYLIHKRKGKIRLEEISDIAGISIASCSKFKSKIQEQMGVLEKKKGVISWEEIIFDV